MRYLIFFFLVLLSACDSRQQNIALGTLERNRIAHTATVNEVVVALPIAQGSLVDKGSILVKLDDTQQKAIVAKAQSEVAQAESYLEKLRNGAREKDVAFARADVAAAKAKLVESKANYKRAMDLGKTDAIGQAHIDKTLANHDANRANLTSAKEHLRKLTNGTRVEDLNMAAASLDAANAVLASEQKKLADLTIIATRDGVYLSGQPSQYHHLHSYSVRDGSLVIDK